MGGGGGGGGGEEGASSVDHKWPRHQTTAVVTDRGNGKCPPMLFLKVATETFFVSHHFGPWKRPVIGGVSTAPKSRARIPPGSLALDKQPENTEIVS